MSDTSTSTVDTSDMQWQADPNHKPDKSKTWSTPIDHDGWVHAHNSVRNEISDILEAFRAVSSRFQGQGTEGIPMWVVESAKSLWSHHLIHVHSHHENEDDIMNPFLRQRIVLPAKLEADHVTICSRLDDVSKAIEDLKEGGDVDQVITALEAYQTEMIPHLLEEEQVALPLMRAYFEHHEVAAQVKKIQMGAPKVETGSFIYYMSKEHFRETFMKENGIPGFLWFIAFRPGYSYFLENVIADIDTMKTGVAPVKKRKWFCY